MVGNSGTAALRAALLASLITGAGAVPGVAQSAQHSPTATLILRDVTVIDATGAPALPHRVVVVQNGRILEIAPLRGFRTLPGARVVEGEGRYLIPGLWDMHIHMSGTPAGAANSRYFLPLLVSWGITGVRDMSGRLERLTAWRDSVRSGTLLGPRMIVTGYKLGSQPVVPGAPYPLRSEADVRESVRALKRLGADFVKLETIPLEFFRALVDECRKRGMAFVGHLNDGMSLVEASEAGQKSFEHLVGVMLAMSPEAAQIQKRIDRQNGRWMGWIFRLGLANLNESRLSIQRQLLRSGNAARAESLYSRLARTQSWQVPTLSGTRDLQRRPESRLFVAEQEPYVPPPTGRPDPGIWLMDTSFTGQMFTRQLDIVRAMHRAGIPLLAGTDAGGGNRLPAFSLVDELDLFVRAGLTPMEALQAATREPARFLGAADTLGTIEPGKVADLVLLDADPLTDIRNVHRVHAVVLRGRYLPPAELDSLRASVRARVAGWRDSVARRSPQP